jgi:hypothetical protein
MASNPAVAEPAPEPLLGLILSENKNPKINSAI